MIWEPLLLTFRVAGGAMLLAFLPCMLLGYVLARRDFHGKTLVSTLVALPLVLPPTAVGYLLLRALATEGWLATRVLGFDPALLLTWKAAVIAAAVMAAPLIVRTARVSFEEVDPRLEQMARTLGYGRLATFARFTLPLAGRGLLAALLLGFTRAVGEFGATVTVAGNIPGRTQTLAAAIFGAQQVGDHRQATALLAVAVAIGFATVLVAEALARRSLHLRPASWDGR